MKRVSRIVSVLMIAVMMMTCVGAFNTVNVSAATGTTSVATKVSTKTTNKKVTMKNKAKKSKVQTKVSTKTSSKVTVNNSQKKVTKKTTVKTTTKTTYTKNSKVKRVKTTKKTTVKTTTVKKTSSSSSSGSGTVSSIRSAVPANTLNAFDKLGFKIVINKDVSYQGVFSAKRHLIELKSANSGALLHEMGHFVSFVLDGAADKSDFVAIYKAEKDDYTGSNKAYVTSTNNEYFAESYRDYFERPNTLKETRPKTYAYMKEHATSITQEDIDRTYSMYSWAW